MFSFIAKAFGFGTMMSSDVGRSDENGSPPNYDNAEPETAEIEASTLGSNEAASSSGVVVSCIDGIGPVYYTYQFIINASVKRDYVPWAQLVQYFGANNLPCSKVDYQRFTSFNPLFAWYGRNIVGWFKKQYDHLGRPKKLPVCREPIGKDYHKFYINNPYLTPEAMKAVVHAYRHLGYVFWCCLHTTNSDKVDAMMKLRDTPTDHKSLNIEYAPILKVSKQKEPNWEWRNGKWTAIDDEFDDE